MDDKKKIFNNLCKFNLATEFVYVRDIKFVSNFLYKYYKDKKLLLYSEGKHSAEVLETLQTTANIIGVVSQIDKDKRYKPFVSNKFKIYNIRNGDSFVFWYIIRCDIPPVF